MSKSIDLWGNFWRAAAIHAGIAISFIPLITIGGIVAGVIFMGIEDDYARNAAFSAFGHPYALFIYGLSFAAYILGGYLWLKACRSQGHIFSLAALTLIFVFIAGVYFVFNPAFTGFFGSVPLGNNIEVDLVNILPLLNIQANYALLEIFFADTSLPFFDFEPQHYLSAMLAAAPIPSVLMFAGAALKSWRTNKTSAHNEPTQHTESIQPSHVAEHIEQGELDHD
jgi:hypothetical protein